MRSGNESAQNTRRLQQISALQRFLRERRLGASQTELPSFSKYQAAFA
jgi:hypothetical protein